jgi:hypothetical protein
VVDMNKPDAIDKAYEHGFTALANKVWDVFEKKNWTPERKEAEIKKYIDKFFEMGLGFQFMQEDRVKVDALKREVIENEVIEDQKTKTMYADKMCKIMVEYILDEKIRAKVKQRFMEEKK